MEQTTKENPAKLRKEVHIELVRRLMLRGVRRAYDIQQELQRMSPPIELTTRTIYRYKGILIRRNKHMIDTKEGFGKTIEDVALDIKETFEEVTRELWVQYHENTATPQTKVAALREIRETTDKMAERMQSLGLVAKAPLQHQILDANGNPVTPIATSDKDALIAEFHAFYKAKHQDPLGSERGAKEGVAN